MWEPQTLVPSYTNKGMISLLRPDTPYNTNEFLMNNHKKEREYRNPFSDSPKCDVRESYSVVPERTPMSQFEHESGVRTPETKKLSPLRLASDQNFFCDPSHFSDIDQYYEQFDDVGGTMEELVNSDTLNMFDTVVKPEDPPRPSISEERKRILRERQEEEKKEFEQQPSESRSECH